MEMRSSVQAGQFQFHLIIQSKGQIARTTALLLLKMIKIKIADFVVEIDNKYDFIEKMSKDYASDDTSVDIFVPITDEDMQKERGLCEGDFPDGYIEAICAYRKIAEAIIDHDAFLMHSAVIEMDGRAYAFLARSGTGKSTHISLWRELFGDKVTVVNGDKPICRFIDGELYAYGTPWCGKEGWNKNTRAPLKALCYVERGTESSIAKISPADSSFRIMRQILVPNDASLASKTLDMIDRMLTKIPSYVLKCNISHKAAELAYDAMKE